jgi:hypothetical protein
MNRPDEPSRETDTEAESESSEADEARAARERARRRAQVFGDVLPESTRDDKDDAAPSSERSAEEWLRQQRPPHHGD